jgi:hypothetical protein
VLEFGERIAAPPPTGVQQRLCSFSMRERDLPVVGGVEVEALAHEEIDAGRVGAQMLKRWTFQLPELERYVALATLPLDGLALAFLAHASASRCFVAGATGRQRSQSTTVRGALPQLNAGRRAGR